MNPLEDFDFEGLSNSLAKWIPLAAGIGLSLFFGVGWIFVPLILLAFFFPALFKLIYVVFLFMVLGTLFTGLVFLFCTAQDWLPWSGASWWYVAKWMYLPTALYSVYLAGDVDRIRS